MAIVWTWKAHISDRVLLNAYNYYYKVETQRMACAYELTKKVQTVSIWNYVYQTISVTENNKHNKV